MKYSLSEYGIVFKALSDETRLKILCQLKSSEELCACNILENLSISQPTLSYHMKILGESGIVESRKDGSWIRYKINPGRLTQAQLLLGCLKNGCDCEAQAGKSCCEKTRNKE